uniref:ZP domain-containing protein n=1 Tax=Tetranychus urticae TaxID=32264 RepID=T1KNH6_TETUR
MNNMMAMMIMMLGIINFNSVLAHWSDDGPTGNGLGKLSALDVICGKDHMTVRAEFAGPFHGIVFSKGTYGQDNCVYIKPYSGVTHATFKVYYDQCGTKPDLQGKYYENTVVIQYGTDIIEAWDEAKRLRCEWFEAYEKPATFRPAIPVADLDVVEMNFQGDDIDCWMEIQEGKGPWGREVSRIVPVGQPMTIVIAINDYGGEFDMRVKSCFAHDGVKPPIHLTDEHGCVLRPKMLTKFEKVKDPNGKATVISYSHFYAFKFPDSMNVQIQCTVEVCRHGCPDACQKTPYKHQPDRQFKQQISFSYGPNGNQNSVGPSVSKAKDEEQHDQQDLQDSASHSIPTSKVQAPSQSPPVSAIDTNIPHHLLAQNFDLKRLPVYRNQEPQSLKNSSVSVNDNLDSSSSDKVSNSEDSASNEDDFSSKGVDSSSSQNSHSTNKQIVVPQTPHHPPPQATPNDEKPVFNHESDQTEYLSNLGGEAYDKASALFKDLGVNMEMAKIASGLIDGVNTNKNFASLLENEKVRELAEASGIKLKDQDHFAPEVQPLDKSVGIDNISPDSDNGDEEDEPLNNEQLTPVASSEHLTSPAPTSYPYSLSLNKETGHQQHQNQQQKQHQHKQVSAGSQVTKNDREKGQSSGNISNNIIQSHTGSVSNSSQPAMSGIRQQQNQNNQNFEFDSQGINHAYRNPQPGASPGLNLENPVAQIVPLQLGIGPIGGPMNGPPSFNNLIPQPPGSQHPIIHHQQRPILAHDRIPPPPPRPHNPHKNNYRQPNVPNHPLHRATSLLANLGNLPSFNLPFLATIQRQDNNPRPSHPHSPLPTATPISSSVPFPQGPRSFRSKRSPSKEPHVSVKKGFQVVTSIDLAFMPNSTDLPEIYEGRREEVVYGVCMPFNED